ncbi:MAG: SDR family oxidoreductase [Candidatus Thiodiazotropha weberae]|nr:SDR family oxidoreductase [Candidatus Thiodiazotropha weberae]
MEPIEKATVLVTGASKGIGLSIAEEFAEHGHNLVLVARGEEALQRVAERLKTETGVEVTVISRDLTEAGAPQKLYEQMEQSGKSVDILVNNAGVGMSGLFREGDYSKLSSMLQLNMLVLTQLTHLFLPQMLIRKRGRVLNLGSLVSYFTGGPNWAAYVASKHYVRALSTGLSKELKGSGVAVTLLSPGATATDFVKTAETKDMLAYQLPIGPLPKQIAKLAYHACQTGKKSVVPGVFNKILAFVGELHPRIIAFEVFGFLSNKKR